MAPNEKRPEMKQPSATKRSYSLWTDEEVATLRQLFGILTLEKLTERLPRRSMFSIAQKAKGLKLKRERRSWTKQQNKLLKQLYTTAEWPILDEAFPDHNRGSISQQAFRLRLHRPAPKQEIKPIEKPPVSDEQVADFMTCGRSPRDLAKKFDLTLEEAQAKIVAGFAGYDLFEGPENISDEKTYVAVPTIGNAKVQERAFTWQRQKDGQPYIVIGFPTDFNHKKLRIIPLDSIIYGDPDHAADRFDAVIGKIAKAPNSFCYLNGDTIARVTGGSKSERAHAILDLTAEFEKKMRRIAHKILFAQMGCHEQKTLAGQGFDPLGHFCAKYGIPYFTEPVYADFIWCGQLFTLWTMHGRSAAQLKGSKINALRRPAQMHEYTHFIVMGHIGDAIHNRAIKVCRDPVAALPKLSPREEFHIILGGFRNYFGTQTARRGIQASSRAQAVLYLYPNGEHHVKTSTGGRL